MNRTRRMANPHVYDRTSILRGAQDGAGNHQPSEEWAMLKRFAFVVALCAVPALAAPPHAFGPRSEPGQRSTMAPNHAPVVKANPFIRNRSGLDTPSNLARPTVTMSSPRPTAQAPSGIGRRDGAKFE
jgi:hypothetical protein